MRQPAARTTHDAPTLTVTATQRRHASRNGGVHVARAGAWRSRSIARTDSVLVRGSVLYEMATGTRLASAADPRSRLRPSRRTLERIIAKCLEKTATLRYQHASDIRTDLQRLKRDTDSGAGTSSSRRQSHRRWKMIVPAAAAVLARLGRRATSIFTARQHSPTRTRLSSRISRTRPAIRCLTTRCARDCPWSFNNRRSSA